MSAFKMTHGGILPGSGNSNHTLIIIMEQYFRSFARERLPEADGGYPKLRRVESAATISASGVEWLIHP